MTDDDLPPYIDGYENPYRPSKNEIEQMRTAIRQAEIAGSGIAIVVALLGAALAVLVIAKGWAG